MRNMKITVPLAEGETQVVVVAIQDSGTHLLFGETDGTGVAVRLGVACLEDPGCEVIMSVFRELDQLGLVTPPKKEGG